MKCVLIPKSNYYHSEKMVTREMPPWWRVSSCTAIYFLYLRHLETIGCDTELQLEVVTMSRDDVQ